MAAESAKGFISGFRSYPLPLEIDFRVDHASNVAALCCAAVSPHQMRRTFTLGSGCSGSFVVDFKIAGSTGPGFETRRRAGCEPDASRDEDTLMDAIAALATGCDGAVASGAALTVPRSASAESKATR